MKKRPSTTETRTVLRTILSAGVLAMLVLACAGTAAGATTWVVDDDGGAGADYTTIQAAVDAASEGDTQADITWFEWTEGVLYVRSGGEVIVPMSVTIPNGVSGTKVFRAKANSIMPTTYAFCTGYLMIS